MIEKLKTEAGRANAAKKAEKLAEQAAKSNDAKPTHEKGAELIRDANNERIKAGLITGKLIGR
jgi:hypothetical protein